MTEEDFILIDKFKKLDATHPTETEVIDFWAKLSTPEYDRLIFLFENHNIDGMDDEARMALVDIFKKLKDKLSAING